MRLNSRLKSVLGTGLLSRLLVLVALSIAPAIAVLAYLQWELHDDQRTRLAEDALHQAELINGDLASIVESARQLTVAISRLDSIRALNPACRTALDDLRTALATYTAMAVLDEAGSVVCASGMTTVGFVGPALRAQALAALQVGVFQTGLFAPARDGHGPMLPFFLPFEDAASGRHGLVLAGLGLEWLARHMSEFRRPPGSTVGISDSAGTTLLRIPDNDRFLGQKMPPAVMPLLNRPHRGNAVIPGFDGMERMVGYVPVTEEPRGLFASVGLSMASLIGEIDRTATLGYLLMGAVAVLSLVLAMLAGSRFLRRPVAALLDAAERWSAGDLAARVSPAAQAGSEFARLARAFDRMAEALSHQRNELTELNATLEARVAERTEDLRASRDHLQLALAEQARSEASLRHAQNLQMVGQLAGGVAHDFNNMLTGILGALDLLARRLPEGDERSLRLIETAQMAAERGGRLTAQLLSFSRRQRLMPESIDLNRLTGGMLELIASTVGQRLALRTELGAGLWPAQADPHQVESAILNLAINARDAMEGPGTLVITTANVWRRGAVTLVQLNDRFVPIAGLGETTPAVASDPAGDGDFVMISMQDSGTGMTEDVLSHVFEPFFTTKPVGQGSGLGLSQVHGLAAQSGGEVQIVSAPGQGTLVRLLLPRAAAPPQGTSQARPASADPPLVVLLVDDHADVRRLIGDMLGELGHHPILAEDGSEALRLLQQRDDVDVLLTDFAMPGLTGPEVIAAAHAVRPDLRTILVTGVVDPDAPVTAACDTVLRKPFTLDALAAAVSRTRIAAFT